MLGKFVFVGNSPLASSTAKSTIDLRCVSTREDFEGVFGTSKGQNIAGVIVTAELNWERQQYTEFYGLEVVRELRVTKHIKCPIVVTSYLPATYFTNLHQQLVHGNFRYFRDPSVSYLPLIEIEKVGLNAVVSKLPPPLDDDLFDDLCENLYHTGGFISELFHEFNKDLRKRLGQYMETKLVRLFF